MSSIGHRIEYTALATIFLWFGLLKVFGQTSATSIIAKTVYWFDPSWVVPALGYWEISIGIFLFMPKLHRVALLLLAIRLPGTLLALAYHFDTCFEGSAFLPTIQGQYLLKELTLVGAAMVIGSTLRGKAH